jgi:hypothetical protein
MNVPRYLPGSESLLIAPWTSWRPSGLCFPFPTRAVCGRVKTSANCGHVPVGVHGARFIVVGPWSS